MNSRWRKRWTAIEPPWFGSFNDCPRFWQSSSLVEFGWFVLFGGKSHILGFSSLVCFNSCYWYIWSVCEMKSSDWFRSDCGRLVILIYFGLFDFWVWRTISFLVVRCCWSYCVFDLLIYSTFLAYGSVMLL